MNKTAAVEDTIRIDSDVYKVYSIGSITDNMYY